MAEQGSHRSEDPFLLLVLAVIMAACMLSAISFLAEDFRRLTTLAAWLHVWPVARAGSSHAYLADIPLLGQHLVRPSITVEEFLRSRWPEPISREEWTAIQLVAGRAAILIHGPVFTWFALRRRRKRPDLLFRSTHDLESLIEAQSAHWSHLGIVRHFDRPHLRVNPDQAVAEKARQRDQAMSQPAPDTGHLLKPAMPPLVPPDLEMALQPETWLRAQGLAAGAPPVALPEERMPGNDREWGHLTSDAICEVLEEQLGRPWTGFDGLRTVHRALVAAIALGHDFRRREMAQLLSTLAALAERAARQGRRLEEILPEHPRLAARIDRILNGQPGKGLLEVATRHGWQKTAIIGMLQAAREDRGVISTASLVWVKHEDRDLWYALNSAGNFTTSAEAAGPSAHYRAEQQAGQALRRPAVFQLSRSLTEDYLDLDNPRTLQRRIAARKRRPVGFKLMERAAEWTSCSQDPAGDRK